MISVKKFVFNPFQVNTYILNNEEGEAVIIDPACSSPAEFKELMDFIGKESIEVQAIINTHGHVDHLLGVEEVRKELDVKFFCHRDDMFLIDNSVQMGEAFGLRLRKPAPPDGFLGEEDSFLLGKEKIDFIHVPGHSPGSLVCFIRKEKILITGDVLFAGSIGRSDLPGGDHELLIRGIQEKLMCLKDDVKVYPGHGPSSTIGRERENNPFLDMVF